MLAIDRGEAEGKCATVLSSIPTMRAAMAHPRVLKQYVVMYIAINPAGRWRPTRFPSIFDS